MVIKYFTVMIKYFTVMIKYFTVMIKYFTVMIKYFTEVIKYFTVMIKYFTVVIKYFTVMIKYSLHHDDDEATDLANIQQVVLVICSVDNNLIVTKDFIVLYRTESIESSSLIRIIKDIIKNVLLRMNLKPKYCCEQSCDEASNMARSGLKWLSSLLMKNLRQCSPTAMLIL